MPNETLTFAIVSGVFAVLTASVPLLNYLLKSRREDRLAAAAELKQLQREKDSLERDKLQLHMENVEYHKDNERLEDEVARLNKEIEILKGGK